MGTFMIWVGAIWALVGFLNIVLGIYNISGSDLSPNWGVASVIFNMVVFIAPGLVLAGIGSLVKRKGSSPEESDGSKICPRCAEEVKEEAKVCRFCGHDFEPQPVVREVKIPPRKSTSEIADLASRYGDQFRSKKV